MPSVFALCNIPMPYGFMLHVVRIASVLLVDLISTRIPVNKTISCIVLIIP